MAVTKRVEGNLNVTINDGFDVQPVSAGSATVSAPALPQPVSVTVANRLNGITGTLSSGQVSISGVGVSLSFPLVHMATITDIIDQINSAIKLATSPNAK